MLITVEGIYENGVVKLEEKPSNIKFAKAIITLIPEENTTETWECMKLSSSSFSEWDNEVDSVYDSL